MIEVHHIPPPPGYRRTLIICFTAGLLAGLLLAAASGHF